LIALTRKRVNQWAIRIVKRKENKTCRLEIEQDQRDKAPEWGVALAFVADLGCPVL